MTDVTTTPERYAERVFEVLEREVVDRVRRLSDSGVELPTPEVMAALLRAGLPDAVAGLDPHFSGIGPFYGSDGAIRQLGGKSKQALDSRRRHGSVLAMQTGDGTWLYPAWQFTGNGAVHTALVPVLRALRGMDRWAAGVWLVTDHPGLDQISPRRAVGDGVDPAVVAALAKQDADLLAA